MAPPWKKTFWDTTSAPNAPTIRAMGRSQRGRKWFAFSSNQINSIQSPFFVLQYGRRHVGSWTSSVSSDWSETEPYVMQPPTESSPKWMLQTFVVLWNYWKLFCYFIVTCSSWLLEMIQKSPNMKDVYLKTTAKLPCPTIQVKITKKEGAVTQKHPPFAVHSSEVKAASPFKQWLIKRLKK